MTGTHFWGCKCCGVYDRHNEVVQPIMAYFKNEWKFSGSTGLGQLCRQQLRWLLRERHGKAHGWVGLGGAPSLVSIVDPNAVSHADSGACSQSFLNPNAGTRSAETTKTDK